MSSPSGDKVTFSSQCGVSVSAVAVDNQRLSLSIQVPVSLERGYFDGLLGNGVPATKSMKDYWMYGERCM